MASMIEVNTYSLMVIPANTAIKKIYSRSSRVQRILIRASFPTLPPPRPLYHPVNLASIAAIFPSRLVPVCHGPIIVGFQGQAALADAACNDSHSIPPTGHRRYDGIIDGGGDNAGRHPLTQRPAHIRPYNARAISPVKGLAVIGCQGVQIRITFRLARARTRATQ